MSFPPEKEKKKRECRVQHQERNFFIMHLLSEFAFHCRDLISFMGSP